MDFCPGSLRRVDKSNRRLMRIRVPRTLLPHADCDSLKIQHWKPLCQRGSQEDFVIDTQRRHSIGGLLHVGNVDVTVEVESAGASIATVAAVRPSVELFEEPRAVTRHLGQEGIRVVGADYGAGLSGWTTRR